MTAIQRQFIEKVELNRGNIKSLNHKDMLCDISDYASNSWIEELEEHKHFGIKFIWEITTELAMSKQIDLFNNIFGGVEKVNIANARMKFEKIKKGI